MLVMIIITTCSDPPIEFSISVPNLSELGLSPNKPVVERSVSENEAERQNYRKLQLKMERRIKNREKLMAMKRYSGFLKRPEILGKVGYFLILYQEVRSTVFRDCLQRGGGGTKTKIRGEE